MIWDAEDLVWVYEPITDEEFASYIGADQVEEFSYALDAATAYVQSVTNQCNPLRPIPAAIYKAVVLEVALEWTRRKDQGTVQQAGFEQQFPVRSPRDPLTYSFPILKRYLPGGFA